ncbi:MAG: hypothetical protein Q8908_01215 [Bacteroidota bacterium]|nr:hypothetical protein [Bacteroidota bacterium]
MHKYIAICFLIATPLITHAGCEGDPAGAGQAGTCGISVFTQGVWSTHNNPAGLAKLVNPETALYIENRFLVKDLFFNVGSLAIPIKNGGFGLALSHIRLGQYANTFAGLAMGRQFSERFSAGVRFDCFHVSFGDANESGNAVSFDAGIQWMMSNKMTFACNVFNPFEVNLNGLSGERIPSIYRAGLSFRPIPELALLTEAEKASGSILVLNYGMEYVFEEKISVRAGLGLNTSKFSFGFGYVFSSFSIDVAASWHQTLGFTPQASVAYKFLR